MSRIGRLPVTVPSGVDVAIDGSAVTVKGPKGSLSHVVAQPISVAKAEDGTIAVSRPDDERVSRSLHGLTRTLINNMVVGVTDGYEKKLEIVGTGYRVVARGSDLEFALGFSHPIVVEPAGGHLVRGRVAHAVQRAGHRQAAGRRGRREHPQAAQARPVQGQGRPVRRRAGPPQGRKGWEVSHGSHGQARQGQRRRDAGRRHLRVRKKVSGTPSRPRLVVSRSARHVYVQVVDDIAGRTLASASTMEADLRAVGGDKTAKAKRSASWSPSGPRPPASRPWCSTGVATATTAGSPRSPTAPAREGCPCEPLTHDVVREMRNV